MAVVSGGNLKQPELIWADCSHLTRHMQISPKADTGEMTADLWPSDDEPSDIIRSWLQMTPESLKRDE